MYGSLGVPEILILLLACTVPLAILLCFGVAIVWLGNLDRSRVRTEADIGALRAEVAAIRAGLENGPTAPVAAPPPPVAPPAPPSPDEGVPGTA